MTLLLLALLGAPPTLSVTSTLALHQSNPDCADCHSPAGWLPAKFDHDQVGWPLEGKHAETRCGFCHEKELSLAIPRSCDGCHRDPHRGELGLRCEGCHDAGSWHSRFGADAHRRSAFPLSGAHAFIPCEECHQDNFSRGFARAAARCIACHADDYQRAAMTSIDHVRAGFSEACETCHTPWRFTRARFPDHETCFQISGGPHGGIGCRECHTSLPSGIVSGACNTGTAACTGCHEHDRADTDDEHRNVPGYQYEDRKCYECHRFTVD